MNTQFDRANTLRCQLMFGPQLRAPVDRRMNDHPAGKWLIAVDRKLEVVAETLCDLGVVSRCAEHVCPSARRLDGPLGAGVVLLGQQRRRESILRRAARMKALR